MGTAQGLIDVARSYLGTTEDDPRFVELINYYNDNTGGYDMTLWDEWCACFVSVCSLKSGNADATGTSVNCAEFRRIWREKGIYREAWETPEAGWLIDYDWQQDGIPDHIGIVVDCDGSTIHVIEGNTDGEMCAEHWIPVGSWSISCFAAPNYDGKENPEHEMEDDMNCLFKPDGKDYMVWFDGTNCHALDNEWEMQAVQEVYRRCNGKEMPCFELGDAQSPWAHRFMDAVAHGNPGHEHM